MLEALVGLHTPHADAGQAIPQRDRPAPGQLSLHLWIDLPPDFFEVDAAGQHHDFIAVDSQQRHDLAKHGMVGGNHAVCRLVACAQPGPEWSIGQPLEGIANFELFHAMRIGDHRHAPFRRPAHAPRA